MSQILGEQAVRARRVLTGHRSCLEALAGALVERESLDGAEVERLIRGASQQEQTGVGVPATLAAQGAASARRRLPGSG